MSPRGGWVAGRTAMRTIWGREPVAVAALARALLLCAVAFGLDLTTEQVAAVMLVVEGLLAFLTRRRVSPLRPRHRIPRGRRGMGDDGTGQPPPAGCPASSSGAKLGTQTRHRP